MQRITSFDHARGFTVFIMPAAHTLLMYGRPDIHQTLLTDIFRFLAEGPGAQLFMLLMGVSFSFSKRIRATYVIKRTLLLFSGAYLLNYFKFIVPLSLGILPDNLLAELQLSPNQEAITFFLFMGDILHFAAIAYPLLYLIHRLKHYALWSMLAAIAIMVISPLVWDVKPGIVFVDSLIPLFNSHPPQTFFPVFPWLVYPLAGLTLGSILNQHQVDTTLKKSGLTGVGLIIASCLFPATTTVTDWPSFYRTESADTLFHLGFVLLWLSVIHQISRKVKDNYFFQLLRFCSRHITMIYLIQWILICWCMSITGYMQSGIAETAGWMCGVTIVTLLLTYSISKTNVQKNL